VRKVAIVVLLVMVGCKRQAIVTSAPSSSQPTSATANPNAPGGATHREALTKFLQAAKAQDVQAMGNVWGTTKGAARTFMAPQEMEMRIIYMMRCLRHDSYAILTESPAVDEKRRFDVQMRFGPLTAVTDFTTTRGQDGRFYLEMLNPDKLNVICSAK
jgi:hypothetical protein